jgi:hypothetical protein
MKNISLTFPMPPAEGIIRIRDESGRQRWQRRYLVRNEIGSTGDLVAKLDSVWAPGTRIPPSTLTLEDYSVPRRLTASSERSSGASKQPSLLSLMRPLQ